MVHNRFSPTSSSNEHDRKITQIRTIIYMLMIIINHLNTFSSRENVILSPEGQFHKTVGDSWILSNLSNIQGFMYHLLYHMVRKRIDMTNNP